MERKLNVTHKTTKQTLSILTAGIIALTILMPVLSYAVPTSSTISYPNAPLIPNITPACKQIILQAQTTQSVGTTSCPQGYTAVGIKINSLPNYYNDGTDYTSQYYQGGKIYPPGWDYMQLRGVGTVIDSTGWGINKLTYASSTNQSNIPASLRFTYPYGDAIQWRDQPNTIQLICARRDINFTTTLSNCN